MEINHPTISDSTIMEMFSEVRNNEKNVLLNNVNMWPGMTTLDIQSAGGYLSDEVYSRLNGDVNCVCIEPAEQLRSRLNSNFIAVDSPVETFLGVANDSIDCAMGLVSLHHSESHRGTLSECWRVLKGGGQLTICEVEENSFVARWLNEYVNDHNPSGHKGNFVSPGQVYEVLNELGFVNVTESVCKVPWIFSDVKDVPVFFKGLFGLSSSLNHIANALSDYFKVTTDGSNVVLDWELIYFFGEKPELLK